MPIKWHLNELMDEARLTYRELRAASGISTEIIARLINEPDAAASSKTVDRLLEALQPHIKRPLTTNDLQEWIPPTPAVSASTPVREIQRSALLPKDAPTDPTLTQAEAERKAALLRQIEERTGRRGG